ncbi:RDD family protein [Halalkalibacter krulwichiae]|uniref:RDD family protein n=1 Tax=Halalkalibacter krulwichiae TaxID=199441 RepID=A0A1X9M5D0_9BACI|nr:RDD family protein [Halalkalibacter krulwichiae]ARK28596.1 RDD family protein [Halalkalibacter krulwichiae]
MAEQIKNQHHSEEIWVTRLLNEQQRAGGWIRLVAGFFDFIFLALVMIVTSTITTFWMVVQSEAPSDNIEFIRRYMWEREFHLYVINWLVLLFVFLLIHFIYALRGKRTVGMRIVDVYVYNEKAEKPTVIQFFKREMLKYLLLPSFFMSFAAQRRPLYDKWSKTYLVK